MIEFFIRNEISSLDMGRLKERKQEKEHARELANDGGREAVTGSVSPYEFIQCSVLCKTWNSG